ANFVWFMQEVLAYAAAGRLREQSFKVGDLLEDYIAGRQGTEEQEGKEVTLHMPDGREEKTRTVARGERPVALVGHRPQRRLPSRDRLQSRGTRLRRQRPHGRCRPARLRERPDPHQFR